MTQQQAREYARHKWGPHETNSRWVRCLNCKIMRRYSLVSNSYAYYAAPQPDSLGGYYLGTKLVACK